MAAGLTHSVLASILVNEMLLLNRWRIDALELGWLAAAIALPLTINPWGSNAFELPKAALLKALTLLMGLVALTRIGEIAGPPADRRSRDPWRDPAGPRGAIPFASSRGGSPGALDSVNARDDAKPGGTRTDLRLVFSALGLGLTFALAAAFSINPRASLWGDYARQQGLVTLSAYLALFLMTVAFLRTREQADRLWRVLVWGSAPILIYALAQALHLDPLDWRSDATSPLVSTLGRSNFVGTYLVLILPLTLARLGVSPFKPIYILLLAAQWLCLALTQARGAWIGAGGALLTMAILWTLAAHKRMRYAWLALIVCVVLLAALLMQMPGLQRLSNLARTDEGSTAARLTIWQTTLSLIAARPLLGYGPETMSLAFPRVFPPQLVYYQGRLFTVDRAHNVWLDMAMSAGLLGLACFGVLLYVLSRRSVKKWRGVSDPWERWLWVALAGSITGHLIDLEFGFDVTATASIFWLLLALSAALGRGWSAPALEQNPRRWTERLPYTPAAVLVALIIGTLGVRPLLADIASRESQMETRALMERIGAGEQAVHLWPLEPEYHLRLAWLYFEAGTLENAVAQVHAADQLSPENPRIEATRGDMFARTARFAQAEDAYRRAIELAPNIAAYHAALGWVLAQQARREQAAVALRRAVDLDATDAATYRELGTIYTLLGRDAEATWAWQEAARWSKK